MAGEQVQIDVGVRGETGRQRDRVDAGADRTRGYRGDIEEDPHDAAVYERSGVAGSEHDGPFVGRGVCLRGVRPRELGGAARPRSGEAGAQLGVTEDLLERVGARLDVARREQEPAPLPTTSSSAEPSATARAAARDRLERGEAEAFVLRRDADTRPSAG